MSPLTRFMNTAREILNAHDAQRIAPNPHQPPIFVRTNWLFAEIDEAHAKIADVTARIKEARLNNDIATGARLAAELLKVAKQLAVLVGWADEQFRKEVSNGN